MKNNKEITTIKVSRKTLNKLCKFKVHPRQSYEEVIIELIKSNKKKLRFSLHSLCKDFTTMKLSKESLLKLNKLKIHPRQSYEEIVQALLA